MALQDAESSYDKLFLRQPFPTTVLWCTGVSRMVCMYLWESHTDSRVFLANSQKN